MLNGEHDDDDDGACVCPHPMCTVCMMRQALKDDPLSGTHFKCVTVTADTMHASTL
jgi:hypothetical protein